MGPSTSDIISSFENDQKNMVFSALSEYLSTGQYVDISLVCRGQVLRAHKVVLSSSSKYFKDFFRHQPGINIIDLDKELAPNDISLTLEDVQLIIGILYCVGTVEISPQRIETLLICAQVLGIPTLISFLKKIRDSIQDSSGKSVKKQASVGGSAYLPPALLPSCHKLARPATEVVYYQPPAAPPGLQPVPFAPAPEARLFTSPAPRAIATVSVPSYSSSITTRGTSTPAYPSRAAPSPVSFQPAAASPPTFPGPLLDLSVVKPLTSSCINTPVPQESSPVPGPSGLQMSGVQDSLLSCQPGKLEPEVRVPRQGTTSRISSASFSSFSLNYLQSPRLKSTDGVVGQEGAQQSLDGFDQNFFMSLNTTLNTLQANQIDDLENVLLPHLSMDRADSAALTSMDNRADTPLHNPLLDLQEMQGVGRREVTEGEEEDDAISSTTPDCSRNTPSRQISIDHRLEKEEAHYEEFEDTSVAPEGFIATPGHNVSADNVDLLSSPAHHGEPLLETTAEEEEMNSSFETASPAKSSVLDLSYRGEEEPGRQEQVFQEIDHQKHRYDNDLVISDRQEELARVGEPSGKSDQNKSVDNMNCHDGEKVAQTSSSQQSFDIPTNLLANSPEAVVECLQGISPAKALGLQENVSQKNKLNKESKTLTKILASSSNLNKANEHSPLTEEIHEHRTPQKDPFLSPCGSEAPVPPCPLVPGTNQRSPQPQLLSPNTISGSIFAHHPTAVRLTPQGGIACTPIQRLLQLPVSQPETPGDRPQATSCSSKDENQERQNLDQRTLADGGEGEGSRASMRDDSSERHKPCDGRKRPREEEALILPAQLVAREEESDRRPEEASIDEADGGGEGGEEEDSDTDSGEIVMNLDQVSGGQKMKFNIPGISQAVTVNFSVEALQEMKNAALRQRPGAEGALEEAAQSEEITSSQIARGLAEEVSDTDASLASTSQDLAQSSKVVKKKNLSRRNLRQKLKYNLKSPKKGNVLEEAPLSATTMQFLCPICNKTFASVTQLNKHQKFHMQRCFPCEECHEVFEMKWQYEEHRGDKHGDQLEASKCPECPETFSHRNLLLAHMQTFHKERTKFKCFVCSLDFNQKHNLFTHLSSWHPNEKVPHCPVCMELFSEQKGFESHDCPGAEIRNRSIVCHLHDTPVSFTNRGQLDSHMREEHGTKGNFNVSCCICHKKFLLRKNLIKHLRNVHKQGTNNKHFCPQCGKQFYYKDDLKNHIQVHEGDMKHVCKEDNCKKAYSTGKALKKHQKLAHEVDLELVTCKVCKKQLSTPFKLRAHMLVHTDSKPFSCSLCSESFKEQRNVVKHMKLKHFTSSVEVPEKVVDEKILIESTESADALPEGTETPTASGDAAEICRPDSTEGME